MKKTPLEYKEAQRLQDLPTYVFAKLDELKSIQRKKGVDLIDLGMGNPDLPVAKPIIKAFQDSLEQPNNWRYPDFAGLPEFREAVAKWCEKQYNIKVNVDNEVIPLIGSKEGVVHFIFGLIDPGDITICPMPAYPAHFRATILAGGHPKAIPLDAENLPSFAEIETDIIKKTKVMILSYPTNPTAQSVPDKVYEQAIAFCKKHNIILIHDFAYAEVYYEDNKPRSIFSFSGAKDIAIEFHTCSKTFSMAGFRIGFAIGNQQLIATLAKTKTNLDYGLFAAGQRAAIAAFQLSDTEIAKTRQIYQKRRDLMYNGLRSLGCQLDKPQATMYLWLPVPHGFDATSFSLRLIEKTGVVVTPGTAFGDEGQGFVRIALVEPEDKLKLAIQRLKEADIHWPSEDMV
jgi:LL-diaminopimelate aminotransferase